MKSATLRVLFVIMLLAALGNMQVSIAGEPSPCQGVNQSFGENIKNRVELERAIAKQMNSSHQHLKIASVAVDKLYVYENWSIVYVNPHVAEPVFLFYSGNPMRTRYVTQWGGTAFGEDETTIKNWVLKNAPGIPLKLAACFAWQVTKGGFLMKPRTGNIPNFKGNIGTDSPQTATIRTITENIVKNITIPIEGRLTKFINGQHDNDEFREHGEISNISFGDLNGDGVADAAFEVIIFAGASGNAHYLCTIIVTPGGPKVIKPIYLGDGVQINKIKINSHKVIMDIVTHGPNDCHNFPTIKKTIPFILKGNNLVSLTPFKPSFLGENLLNRR